MAPEFPGAAEALPIVSRQVGALDLGDVRVLLEKLIERRLLAPLSTDDQVLWELLVVREQELLDPD